jgi:hypothetical protein
MERSRPTLVLSCRIGAFSDEKPCKIKMTIEGRLMEWGGATLVLGCRIGAVVEEESRKVKVTV